MLALSACDTMTEVSDPFYIGFIEDPGEVYLFRCLEGGKSCAVDGLPGPGVVAAGADARHVVVRLGDGTYVWFRRIAREKSGWGTDPEKLIGPISQEEFRRAQRANGLPEPSITP
ncbi:MAG: hypothetical protein ACKOPQ_00220 [Novosphingobium sp.]